MIGKEGGVALSSAGDLLKPGMESVVCDLCHSDQSEVVTRQRDLLLEVTNDEFTIVKCSRCGLIYLNPRPSKTSLVHTTQRSTTRRFKRRCVLSYNNRRRNFLHRSSDGCWKTIMDIPRLLPLGGPVSRGKFYCGPIRRYANSKAAIRCRGEGKVLDVGCGAGGNLKALQEQGWQVFGIEISDVAAAHARDLLRADIHTGTLESAPFPPKSFDLVLMSHSLEHLPSPADALRRVHSLLKDNGLLVVSVPNVNSLEYKLFGRWWFQLDTPRHFYQFDKRSLSRFFTQAGFLLNHFRTGVSDIFFMASLDRLWTHRFRTDVPFRKLIDRLIARPVSLIAGHLGYGTEITAYAVKQQDAVLTSSRAL